MSAKNRVFSREFKQRVAERILNGERVSALHQELQIKRSVLYRWRDVYRKDGAAGLRGAPGRPPGIPNPPRPASSPEEAAARRISELERKIGQQALENDFLRRAFKRFKGVAPEEHREWRDSIYGEIRGMMQFEGFRADRACEMAHISRAGFYRHYEEHEPRQADMELRDLIQSIALENCFYGYRRVTAELAHQGVVVNHKRVSRLMRADNLLAVRKRRFVFTTDSRHSYAIYSNLAGRMPQFPCLSGGVHSTLSPILSRDSVKAENQATPAHRKINKLRVFNTIRSLESLSLRHASPTLGW